MKIKIKNATDLNKLLEKLSLEIVDANIYHCLYCNLVDSIKDNAKAFSQSNTFWNYTLKALDDARIIRLCRVFDQQTQSLNLFKLLETVKMNIHFFNENHFRERLKENPFVDSLAGIYRTPDKSQLDTDIWFSSNKNPMVKKLMVWRNNIIAHHGARVSLGNDEILANNPLSQEEVENLLDECFIIINRYSNLYRASTYSRKAVGHDDYKSLLKFINLGLEKQGQDLKKEIQKLIRKQA